MKEKNGKSAISGRFIKFFPVFMLLFAVMAVFFAARMYLSIHERAEKVKQYEAKRELAYRLAEQFETGSNTLTYEAKQYCETGEVSHFNIYIKELTEDRNRDIALQALFRMGLSRREISRMQAAKIASDDLSNRELWAMELISLGKGSQGLELPEGVTDNILTEKEKQLPSEEKYRLGYESIMSAAYFLKKSEVDTNVREFAADLMQHYGDSTLAVIGIGTGNSLTSFLIILFLVVFMVVMLFMYSHIEKESAAELSRAVLEAKKASKAKSDFLSSMSHDIRTPMNAIIGMTNMAVQNIEDKGKAMEDLSIVQSSSRHLLSLINDVLDLSRIESGKMVFAKEPYTIPEVLKELTAIMMPLCTAKSQSYFVHTRNIRHEFVIGDQTRLKQVLVNLLNNANKYTPPGGRIDFTAEEMESGEPGTALYQFTVKDTGIGISKEKINAIFEPFERETATTVNEVEGTGLGLSIARNILETRGGSISVSSEKGKGSVFTAITPVTIQETDQALLKFAELKGKRLILFYRSEDFLRETGAMLTEAGVLYDSVSETEKAAALSVSLGNPYFAILIEYRNEALKPVATIRKAAPKLPIILICAGNLQEMETGASEAGADSILVKPVFRSILYEKLRDVLRGQAGSKLANDGTLTGKRFLIADDQAINRMIVEMMLVQFGASSEQAENGNVACRMFEKSPDGYYDGILMDVMMPEMGGYEATRLIRSMNRKDAARIPIVAMTANAFAEDIEKSREAGMNAHINKPIEPETVKCVLEEIYRGGESLKAD